LIKVELIQRGDKTPLYKSKDKETKKLTLRHTQGKGGTCKARGKEKNRELLH